MPKKKVLPLVFAAAVIISLGACDMSARRAYYNELYGITMTIQDGLFIDYVNERNMSETKNGVTSYEELDMVLMEDGYYAVRFIELSNKEDANDPGFAQLVLVGVTKEYYLTLDEFIDDMMFVYDTELGDYEMSVVDNGVVNLNGKAFRNIAAVVNVVSEGIVFNEDFYFVEIDDIYVYAYLFSYEDNAASKADAGKMLEGLTIK